MAGKRCDKWTGRGGGEKRKRETFIYEYEGGDGESYSGCNAVWILLVMEKGRNYLWILTVFVIDLFWLVIGPTEKVLSHTQCSHWNCQLLDCYGTAGVRNKQMDITKLVKKMSEWQKITELQDQTPLEQTIDWKIHEEGSKNRSKRRADDEGSHN